MFMHCFSCLLHYCSLLSPHDSPDVPGSQINAESFHEDLHDVSRLVDRQRVHLTSIFIYLILILDMNTGVLSDPVRTITPVFQKNRY